MEKDVLKNFKKFTVKHLCQSLFFNKLSGIRFATLSKKKTELFSYEFCETTSGRLPLAVVSAVSFTRVINSNVMFSSHILLIY